MWVKGLDIVWAVATKRYATCEHAFCCCVDFEDGIKMLFCVLLR